MNPLLYIAVLLHILAFAIAMPADLYAQKNQNTDIREVRAVWLTTNSGLDWPKGERDPKLQQKALSTMLDKLAAANFNLVMFQVQANGDVLWESDYEPPMEIIAGKSKKLPYDVCRYVIDECHKRGIECHAWIVPFRIGSRRHAGVYADFPTPHPAKTMNRYVVEHNGTMYLDPGYPEVTAWLLNLYAELIEKYNFDGINLDYTRYPDEKFNDIRSYRLHGNSMDLKQWRRANINTFVIALYDMAKNLRPDLTIGSAPIGTYKNIKRYRNATAYHSYQQDPGAWIGAGCQDMIIPQMYWDERSGFTDNMDTWAQLTAGECVFVVGLAPYKMVENGWKASFIADQIRKVRKKGLADGVCMFRAEHVTGTSKQARELYRLLCNDLFKTPAKLPWSN